MSKSSAPTARVPRILRMVLPVAVVVVVAGTLAAVLTGGDDAEDPVFNATTRTVTYEVLGSGRSELITYTSGEGNKEKTVSNAKLPWKLTVELPVGVSGGTANLLARNPENDTTVTCRISMGGKPVNEVVATDGYVDPSCSVQLTAELAK
jgi:hypothetical protein